MRFKMIFHLEPILNRKRKIKLKFIMCTLKKQRFKMNKGEYKQVKAKDYLQQLSRLNVIIRQKMKEQADLRNSYSCIGSTDTSKERVSGGAAAEDAGYTHTVDRLVDLEEEINREIDEYADLKHKIINQIQGLQEVQYIDLLHQRYVEELTFEEIAVNMTCSIRNVYNLHGQALQAFQQKYLTEM